MAKKKSQVYASVLAFDRRISSSNAIFYGVQWDERHQMLGRPLPVQEKSVRGVIDHRLEGKQASQTHVEANIENPNLQTVDYCALGMEEDTLRVRFNLQVAGKIGPCACNNPVVADKIDEMTEKFAEKQGFQELCNRYVQNMANGRFLWRNRLGAEKIEVVITMDEEKYVFDALSIPTKNFDNLDDEAVKGIESISHNMASVLSGNKSHVNLAVDACVKKFPGLEVYPSQELVTDNSRGRGKKSKHLFVAEAKEGNAAALHPQKVTNAIHTIDDWYGEAIYPISVNSYGVVTTQGHPYRVVGQSDFYTLFDKAMASGSDVLDPDDKNFVMAMLVRGGVFGKSEDKGE